MVSDTEWSLCSYALIEETERGGKVRTLLQFRVAVLPEYVPEQVVQSIFMLDLH